MTIDDTLKVLQQRTMIIWEELRKLKAQSGGGGGDCEVVIETLQGPDTNVNLTVLENDLGDLSDIIEAINGDTIDGIMEEYNEQYADELQEIIGM